MQLPYNMPFKRLWTLQRGYLWECSGLDRPDSWIGGEFNAVIEC